MPAILEPVSSMPAILEPVSSMPDSTSTRLGWIDFTESVAELSRVRLDVVTKLAPQALQPTKALEVANDANPACLRPLRPCQRRRDLRRLNRVARAVSHYHGNLECG